MRSFDGLMCQQGIKLEMAEFRRSPLMPKYKELVHVLYRHTGIAFTSAALEFMLGIHGAEVRQCIRHARRCGHPIASGAKGYWVENDPIKMVEMSQRLRSRALDILETAHFVGKSATRRQHWSLWSRAVRAEQIEMRLH